MKVKFLKSCVVVKPGSGSKVYKGKMDIDKDLAERWAKLDYLEILEDKPKRIYKRKKVEDVEYDG